MNKTIRIDSIAALVGCGATLNVQAQGGDLVLNGLISQTNNCGSGFLDFSATGGRLISGPNSPDTGNIVQCNCADTSPMDGVCDSNVCLSDPVGLNPAKATPATQLTPIVLAP